MTVNNKDLGMYKKTQPLKSTLSINKSYEGEPIEVKIERILQNQEPITDGAPPIFTERKDGVMPEYDVRTDRFEVAIDAMDKVSKAHIAKREERLKKSDELKAVKGGKDDGGAESTQATVNE